MSKLTKDYQAIFCMEIVINKKENKIYVDLLKDKDNCWVIPKEHMVNEFRLIKS